MRDVVQAFGPVEYAIPRIGEHGRLACVFGRHWWALVRSVDTKAILGIKCPVCGTIPLLHGAQEMQTGGR